MSDETLFIGPQQAGKTAVIVCGMDFAATEMLILSAIADRGISSIVLDLESPCELRGRQDIMDALLRDMPMKTADVRPPPSYLKHDPTKNVRRRRRR